jgi:mannosyltransferase
VPDTGPGRALPPGLLTQLLARLTPPLVTFVITVWGITSSSYWRDEAATMVADQRPFSQLIRMLGHVDVEHGLYYVLLWPIVQLGGTGELITRLPSAVAMAAAAAFITALGARLVSLPAGIAAGLVFGVIPSTSLYAQNARPDALAVAGAVIATYLLVRLLQAERSRWRWLAGYAACMAVLGWIDLIGLFLLAAHAVTVAAASLRTGDPLARRRLALGWLAAAVSAVAANGPLIALAYQQRAQVNWIRPPGLDLAALLPTLLSPLQRPGHFSVPFLLGIAGCIAAGLLASGLGGRARLRQRWPARLLAVVLPWLVLPGTALLLVSALKPLYFTRYILFCVPALALLAGAAIVALGRLTGLVTLVIVALLGLPAQQAIRQADGHGENIRAADRIVATYARSGDAVIFHNHSEESLSYAYPYGLGRLRDISQALTPAQSGTLTGTKAPRSVIHQRAEQVQRVWVVNFRRWHRPTAALGGLHFRFVRRWHFGDLTLYLYARRGSA